MPIRFGAVSQATKRFIDIGDEVIQECRALVQFGAGNQKADVEQSKGKAFWLTEKVKAAGINLDKPLRTASVTCAYGAGVCHHMAIVAYTILRSKLTAGEIIEYYSSQTHDHGFIAIFADYEVPHNKRICVDPWPIITQALLLEDHFCGSSHLTMLLSKTGGKGANYMDRLRGKSTKAPSMGQDRWPANASRVRQEAEARRFDVDDIIAKNRLRDVLYCSKDRATLVYRVRARWVPDKERPQCHGCNKAFGLTVRRHHCRLGIKSSWFSRDQALCVTIDSLAEGIYAIQVCRLSRPLCQADSPEESGRWIHLHPPMLLDYFADVPAIDKSSQSKRT
jgi:FYVE zinc finger